MTKSIIYFYIFFEILHSLNGQVTKGSLNFVNDDRRVKKKANKLVDAVLNSNATNVNDFVLGTFNDPGYSYPSTKDLRKGGMYERGSSTTLNCPYTNDSGEHDTRWYKNGYLIKHCTNTKCTLELSSMTTADSGIYTCRVSTINGSYTTHNKVIVGFKPRFRGEVETIIRFIENSYVLLNCSTYAEPAPTVKWYYSSSFIGKITLITGSKNPDHYDFKMKQRVGKYECVVSNDFGTITRTFEIQSDSACEMNIEFNRNMPLFLTRKSTWILTNNIPINTDIKIVCIKHEISNGKRKFISPLYATCIGKTIFKTQYGNIDISELKCNSPIESVIRGNNESCTGNGNSELVQVGFQIQTFFLNVYDVCVDKVKNYPLFAKYAMNDNAANSLPKELVHYVESSYMPFIFEDLYDCRKQVGSIFAKTGVNISEGNKCCFAKRQLVSPKDMLPGLPQLATYNYVHVIPQWSTCGTENWDEVERRVRSLAISKQTILEIWTGTSESIKLPNQKFDTYVTINDKYGRTQRVPRYIWKIVISKQNSEERNTEEGLAIVVMNSPNLKAEALEEIPCKRDICNETKWMYGSQWRDPSKGLVFCCDLADFMSTFNYNNLFSFMKPLK